MEEKERIIVQNPDGTTMEVELVTFLLNDDKSHTYLVYSKGELSGNEGEEVIYISRVIKDGQVKLLGIQTDEEWQEVQSLLKKIANA